MFFLKYGQFNDCPYLRKKVIKVLKINVQNMINATTELQTLIESYEENTQMITHELQNSELNWHDDNSGIFFDYIKLQKSQLTEFIANLYSTKNKYDYLISEIKKINNNIRSIFSDQNKENGIIASYNSAIDELRNLRYRLGNLNTYFCSYYEQRLIRNEITRLNNNVNALESSKRRVIEMYRKLNDLEAKIITTLSKITIKNITEIDYSQFM